jgi:hypothetical protein
MVYQQDPKQALATRFLKNLFQLLQLYLPDTPGGKKWCAGVSAGDSNQGYFAANTQTGKDGVGIFSARGSAPSIRDHIVFPKSEGPIPGTADIGVVITRYYCEFRW